MKAPETIFLRGYSFDDEPCKNWTLEPLKKGLRGHTVQNEKYIRKDALLEWVREKKERLGKMFDAMPSTAIGAKLDACKEFIEKIESL